MSYTPGGMSTYDLSDAQTRARILENGHTALQNARYPQSRQQNTVSLDRRSSEFGSNFRTTAANMQQNNPAYVPPHPDFYRQQMEHKKEQGYGDEFPATNKQHDGYDQRNSQPG